MFYINIYVLHIYTLPFIITHDLKCSMDITPNLEISIGIVMNKDGKQEKIDFVIPTNSNSSLCQIFRYPQSLYFFVIMYLLLVIYLF